MIANAQYEIQIVDTHESLETLINVGVAVGTSQFNRTLVDWNRNEIPYLTIFMIWPGTGSPSGYWPLSKRR